MEKLGGNVTRSQPRRASPARVDLSRRAAPLRGAPFVAALAIAAAVTAVAFAAADGDPSLFRSMSPAAESGPTASSSGMAA